MTRAALIVLFALILVGCAPASPEAITAQNNAPGAISQAEAERLKAISDFLDAQAARERARQTDYSWIVAVMLSASFILAPLALGAYMLYRMGRSRQSGNVYNIVVLHHTPRGRWMQADNGSRTLETGEDVTHELARIIGEQVRK